MQSEISKVLPKHFQQEEISQEYKDLISCLPKERGWISIPLYQYQGFWYAVRYLQAVFSCQKHFQVQDSDIFLVTTPKSGTTWLKAIMFTLINRTRYPISSKNHPLITSNPHEIVPYLEINLYVDNQIPDFSTFASPRILATHVPYVSLPISIKKSSSCKIVYLCRDPKDIFVSLWQFTNKFRLQEMGTNSIEDVFDLFCKGITIFGPLWDHVLEYWNQSKENPDKFMFLKYEDVKEQPEIVLKRLAKFLKCPFSKEEDDSGLVQEILKLCSFDSLSKLEVNQNGKLSSGEGNNLFFRRGAVGDWRNHLSEEMVAKIDEITDHKFSGTGLSI